MSKRAAEIIGGGLVCVAGAYLYAHGTDNFWVILMIILGALNAL